MRLTYPDAPSEIRDLAYRALNLELVRLPEPEQEGVAVMHEASDHVPNLHKVFLLPLRAAASGDLRAAKHISWYDILVISGIRVGVEVAIGKGKTGPSSYVRRGPDIDRQIAILTALAKQPAEHSREVRILRVPPAAPFSFWLHGRRKGQDSIVPVIAIASSLEPGRAYEPESFLEAVGESAARLLDNPRPKSGRRRPRAKRVRRKAGGKRPAR